MADSQRRPMACLGQSGRVLVLTFSLLLLSISTGAHLPPPPYEEAMRLVTDRALGIATVWQEARGLDYQGKVNVASAMRNRMKKKYSSDGTVAGTVLRDRQFSGWNASDPNRVPSAQLDDKDPVVMECARAWDASEFNDTVNGAVLYYAKSMKTAPHWAQPSNSKILATDSGHIFLVPKL
jgi:hypothetical protein